MLLVKTETVSQKEADALKWALHLWRVLDRASICTGRSLRRDTCLELERRGYLSEVDCVVVDGDGFLVEPERWRKGFRLTWRGMVTASRIEAVERVAFKARWAAMDDALEAGSTI